MISARRGISRGQERQREQEDARPRNSSGRGREGGFWLLWWCSGYRCGRVGRQNHPNLFLLNLSRSRRIFEDAEVVDEVEFM